MGIQCQILTEDEKHRIHAGRQRYLPFAVTNGLFLSLACILRRQLIGTNREVIK